MEKTRTRKPLTASGVKDAKPKDRAYKLTDLGNGLVLLVTPSGSKLWRRRLRVNGKETMFALGRYPEVGLAEARQKAQEAFALARDGISPAIRRKAVQARAAASQAATFRAVAQTWLKHRAADWAVATLRQRRRLLEAYIYPVIGDLPVGDVTSAVVNTVLDGVHRKAPAQTPFARQVISGVMGDAIIMQLADTDPVYVLRDRHKPIKVTHHRALDKSEIKPFLEGVDASPMHEHTRIAVYLALWTLSRSVEVIGAMWREFNLEACTWTLPAERMKKREEHTVPLPRQAVAMLKGLREFMPHREYLFPNAHDPRKPASRGFINKPVTALGFENFSAHGIRSTGSTMLNGMGYKSDWIETQLAHLDRNKTRRSYNRAIYLEERREMMQQWADYLDALRTGAKVLGFKAA